jgi:hypothetical protein
MTMERDHKFGNHNEQTPSLQTIIDEVAEKSPQQQLKVTQQ